MNSERWALVRELFLKALELAPGEREAFVRERAGEDAELETEVRRLLHGHESSLAAEDGVRPSADIRIAPSSLPEAPRRLGDFELLDELGSGGMGVVYKARQVSLDRIVAVKVLRHALGTTEGRRREFRGEPEKAAKLRHPNIVPIHLLGEEGGLPYFVMDYVPGRSLRELLAEARVTRQERGVFTLPPPLGREGVSYPARVAETIAKVADALQYSHGEGIVHRDVKPGNLLIDQAGEPHLVDFGIAKRLDAETVTSRIIGTPHYMSPEQARLHSMRVDHRTDIYSLGVVLYELLTLYRPFEGETYTQVFLAIRQVEPPLVRKRNPEVPKDLETICHKAMRKEPRDRYATAEEFAADLRRFLALKAPLARPPSLAKRALELARRRAAPLAVLLTCLLVAPLVWKTATVLAAKDRLRAAVRALPRSGELERIRYSDDAAEVERAVAELESGRAALRSLRAEFPDLPRADAQLSDDLERLLAERGSALAHASADAMFELLRASRGAPGGMDLRGLALRVAQVLRIAGALPDADQAKVRALVDGILPRLSLRSVPPGALVKLVALDPVTELVLEGSEPVEVGTTDLEEVPVPSGFYRIVVEGPDGSYGELTAWISELGGRYSFPPLVLRPTAEVTADMVLVPAGDFRFPEIYPPEPAMPVSPVSHGPFWVDRHEVTNAQYRRFCLETGHPPPPEWPEGWRDGWRREWDRLPVAWVDVYDAEAFAAWAGKRLLVRIEWERAARGPEGHPFPWGPLPENEEAVRARARVDLPRAPPGDLPVRVLLEQAWELYAASVAPVESHLQDRCADGAYDLQGNVAEWTVSPDLVLEQDGRWVRSPGNRFAKGGAWKNPPERLNVDIRIHAAARDDGLGFRCGKGQR